MNYRTSSAKRDRVAGRGKAKLRSNSPPKNSSYFHNSMGSLRIFRDESSSIVFVMILPLALL